MKTFLKKISFKLNDKINKEFVGFKVDASTNYVSFSYIKFICLSSLLFITKLFSGGYSGEFSIKKFIKKLKSKIRKQPVYVSKLEQDLKKYLLKDVEEKELSSILNDSNFLNNSDGIDVSIIIPVYNQWKYTVNCLRSISNNCSGVSFEVILIDDCSTDLTQKICSKWTGLNYYRNEVNSGFIKNCNKGAALAKGKYVLFLNNDTQVLPGWLKNLVSCLESSSEIGLVGSKLIYPDGVLQEAGGIIWSDASGYNYGKFADPSLPEYNYRRDADYCSGASIIIGKDFFNEIGGFSELYLPAYYEDTDLAFAVREKGKRVVYEPTSVVVHYEGVTSGTDVNVGVKSYQVQNAVKFYEKWKNILEEKHYSNPQNSDVYHGANRNVGKRTVLVIDSYVPRYDKESGSNRLLHILKMMKSLDYHVIFLPDNGQIEEPYNSILSDLGIEQLYVSDYVHIMDMIKDRIKHIDVAWVCRPELNSKFQPLIKKINPKAKIIYDTIDIHFLRHKRESDLGIKSSHSQPWEEVKKVEVECANGADLVLAITEDEKDVFSQLTKTKMDVIPNIHVVKETGIKGFAEREGLLFIGGYSHTPNVDAVIWLVKEIMPIVWKKIPELKLTLLGSNPTSKVKALQNDRVVVTGFVHDVSSYFEDNKVFVSPLRYGAGMKGKIGQSMEYQLPIVSTSIGVEGMFIEDRIHALVSDDAQDFADNIIELYSSEKLWSELQKGCVEALYPFTFDKVVHDVRRVLEG